MLYGKLPDIFRKVVSKSKKLEHLRAALILLIFLNIYFFPIIWGGKTFVPLTQTAQVMPDGVYNYSGYRPKAIKEFDPGAPSWIFYPACKLINRVWFSEHDIALWNPYNGVGIPYIAESEVPIYSIFASIVFLFPSTWAIDIYILLKFFLAGLFMYFFSKKLHNSFTVAIFCGVAYMFQGYSLLFLNHIPNNVYFMTPLLFLGFYNLLKYVDFRNSVIMGIILSFVIFGAFPESSFLVILIGYSFLMLTILVKWEKQAVKIIGYAIFSGLIGLFLSAIYLFPLYELTINSFNVHSKEFTGTISGLVGAGPIAHYFIKFLIPLFDSGNIFESSIWGSFTYFGLVVFSLGVFSITYTSFYYFKRLKKTRFSTIKLKLSGDTKSLIVFLLLLLFMFLKFSGYTVVNWIGKLPILSMIVYPIYLSPLIAFCMVIIGGYGLKYFLRTRRARLHFLQYLSVVFVMLIISYYCMESFQNSIGIKKHMVYFSLPVMVGFGFVILLLEILFIRIKRIIRPNILSFLCIIAVAFELFFNFIFVEYYYYDRFSDREDIYREAPYIGFLKRNSNFYRAFGVDNILFPNWSGAFQVFDIRSLYALTPLKWVEFYRFFFPGGKQGEDTFDKFSGQKSHLYSYNNSPNFKRFAKICSIKYYLSLSGFAPRIDKIIGNNEQTPSLRKSSFVIDNKRRQVFFTHPNIERIPWKVELPEEVTFVSFDVAMDSAVWSPEKGDGVTFKLEVKTKDDKITTIFERYIDPKNNPKDRNWIANCIDISKFRGQSVMFLFSALSNDSAWDWAGWSGFDFYDKEMNDISAKIFKNTFDTKEVYNNEIFIHEIDDILPRASIFHKIEIVDKDRDVLHKLKDLNFSISRTLIIKGGVSEKITEKIMKSAVADNSEAKIIEYKTRRVKIQARIDNPGFLMLNDLYYPGWRAYVDGKETKIYNADYLFRAVFLEEGKHVIEFEYKPLSFRIGLIFSLFTLLAVIVLLRISRKKGEKGSVN